MMEVVAEAGAQQPWDQFKEEVEIKEEDGGGHDAVGEPLTREIKKRLDHAHGSSNGNGAHHANGGEEKEEGEDNANGGEEEEVKVAPEEKHESIFFDPAKGHNKSTCKLRHGIASAGPSANVNAGPSGSANAGPSGSANPPAYAPCHVPAMGSQQSTAKRGKRKATSDLGAKNVKKRATNAGSQGTRSYTTSGNTINVHPLVQGSQASSSVTVNVSYGTATARSTSNGTGTRKKKYERLRNLLGFEK